jgi:UrcA family protein
MTARSIIFSLAATAAAMTASAPAFASETATAAVSIAKLDLTSDRGRAQLDRRIARAAEDLCGRPDRRDLTLSVAADECMADVLASARPQREAAIARNSRYAGAAAGAAVTGSR